MSIKGAQRGQESFLHRRTWLLVPKPANKLFLHFEVLLVVAGCEEHLNKVQVTYNLFNSSNHLLSNQADHPQGSRCAGVLRSQSTSCLTRTFLGLMFMRFQTSAVLRSALVTPLKSNVVTRGRLHSTYCLWGRLGLGASLYDRAPHTYHHQLLSLPTVRNGGELDCVLGGLGSF